MAFFVEHWYLAWILALVAIYAIWRVSRRWDKPMSRETARLLREMNRAPIPQRSPDWYTLDQVRDKIHRDAVTLCRARLSWDRDHPEEYHEPTLRRLLEHIVDFERPVLDPVERDTLIQEVIGLLGFGPAPNRKKRRPKA